MRARASVALLTLLCGCLDTGSHDGELGVCRLPLDAYCDVRVEGVGTIDVENDYLPHVVSCENGGASFEALRAQAVAARSYMHYKLNRGGSIADGTSDQVYTCSRPPRDEHYEAVRATSGQVIMYEDIVVCSFYVAGAIPSADSCVANSSDRDPTNTERYVTYNWGLAGGGIEQTRLGWVNPGNDYNRGCMSQNGSDCLSDAGWAYDDILRFYYGDDAELETTVGSCVVTVEPDGDGDADSDVDADTDVDSDTDSDADADSDADTDVDGDADGDLDTEDPSDADVFPDGDVSGDSDLDVDEDWGYEDSGFPPDWYAPHMYGGCATAGRGLASSGVLSLLLHLD